MKNEEIASSLARLEEILTKIGEKDWQRENLQKILLIEAQKLGDKGALLWPLRVSLTGKEASAGPFEIAQILGKNKTLKRIKRAQSLL